MQSIEIVKGSDGSGNANLATIQSSRSPGATTIDVDTVLGINPAGFAGTMGTPHTFTDPITSETITVISEATAVDFTGHVDGANLEIDDIAPGYTDAGSEVGDIVIIRPTTQYGDNLAAVLEEAHNDDGSLKDDAVTTDAIADDAVTTDKIPDDAVTPEKLSTKPWQYLGSAQYSAGTVTSSGATPTLVTNLTVPVTIPSWATAVRITVDGSALYIQTGAAIATLGIYQGATAGALTTRLGASTPNIASGTAAVAHAVAVVTSPTPGATHFSAAISAASSNAKLDTGATAPAIITVEVC